MNLKTVAVVAVVCLVLVAAGLVIDAKGFAINMIASAIGIIVTVTLVDWLLERKRRRRWTKAREQIITALLWHLGNIACESMTHFHNQQFDFIYGSYFINYVDTVELLDCLVPLTSRGLVFYPIMRQIRYLLVGFLPGFLKPSRNVW